MKEVCKLLDIEKTRISADGRLGGTVSWRQRLARHHSMEEREEIKLN